MPTLQSETMHNTRAAGNSASVPAPQKAGSGSSILQTVASMAKNFVAKHRRPGHDARAVANYLLRHAQENGVPVAATDLVKLVFLSHGWMLGLHHRPLIRDKVVTTSVGPMIWGVYRGFKQQGLNLHKEIPSIKVVQFTEQEKKVMEDVFQRYSTKSPFELTSIITRPGTPWYQARPYGKFLAIPDAITREYYFNLAEKNRKKQ